MGVIGAGRLACQRGAAVWSSHVPWRASRQNRGRARAGRRSRSRGAGRPAEPRCRRLRRAVTRHEDRRGAAVGRDGLDEVAAGEAPRRHVVKEHRVGAGAGPVVTVGVVDRQFVVELVQQRKPDAVLVAGRVVVGRPRGVQVAVGLDAAVGALLGRGWCVMWSADPPGRSRRGSGCVLTSRAGCGSTSPGCRPATGRRRRFRRDRR